jgi:hypothetical protein
MTVPPGPVPSSPVLRLSAEGRILAGFLTEEVAQQLPEFSRADASVQSAIREKYGVVVGEAGFSRIPPKFRHITEREVIEMLSSPAVAQAGGPTHLHNLIGLEWVGIDGILAGHYIASPMPAAGRSPASGAPVLEIAKFCVLGTQVTMQDIVRLGGPTMATPEKLQCQFTNFAFGPAGLSVQYSVGQEVSPIHIFLVEDRLIAIRHQERLVALLESGVHEALCLVSYGYGQQMLGSLPGIDPVVLESHRPPQVADFINPATTIKIPVRTPISFLTFSHQLIPLTFPS